MRQNVTIVHKYVTTTTRGSNKRYIVQSLTHKTPLILSYLRSGTDVIITLIIFGFFFAVHDVRILLSVVGVYGGAIGLFIIGVLKKGIYFALNSIKKSHYLHKKMFESVVFARKIQLRRMPGQSNNSSFFTIKSKRKSLSSNSSSSDEMPFRKYLRQKSNLEPQTSILSITTDEEDNIANNGSYITIYKKSKQTPVLINSKSQMIKKGIENYINSLDPEHPFIKIFNKNQVFNLLEDFNQFRESFQITLANDNVVSAETKPTTSHATAELNVQSSKTESDSDEDNDENFESHCRFRDAHNYNNKHNSCQNLVSVTNPTNNLRQMTRDLNCLLHKPFKFNKGKIKMETNCLYTYIRDKYEPTTFKQFSINITGFVKVPLEFHLRFPKYKSGDKDKFTKYWKFDYYDYITKSNAKASLFKYIYFSIFKSNGFFRPKTHTNYWLDSVSIKCVETSCPVEFVFTIDYQKGVAYIMSKVAIIEHCHGGIKSIDKKKINN
ncbi:unnamed protein product [Brachionus calyciflorus]|uniref:Uncharacterized protein n=1 Tax=Brachionus calyciflorus TaxID=104777 RepID=A0A814FEN0_9BILA|nr:unnamed protein product [Brachionus calyciflorus]